MLYILSYEILLLNFGEFMSKNNIGYIFFIAFIFLSIFIMYKLLKPFGMIIFFAVVFYVVLNPLFIKAMGKSYKKKR